MLGGIAAVILVAASLVVFVGWVNGVLNSDGRCDPGADCESCPFPCDNHERKRREKK